MKSVFLFAACILMAGCCKMICEDTDTLAVSFEKFKTLDTDTVLLVKYQPGAQQVTSLDTIKVYNNVLPTDTMPSRLVRYLSSSFDWKIIVPSVRKQYIVSDFVLSSKRCPCGGGGYKSIDAFSVDGRRKGEAAFLVLE